MGASPMKTSTSAIAALLVAAIGTTAIIPVASAQDSVQLSLDGAQGAAVEDAHFRPDRAMRDDRRGGPGELLDMVCSEDGAENLEIALVRLSHRLDLTEAQQPLFDTLKTAALTAQTSFADTCAAARPAKDADPAPDLIDRMKARIAIDTARIEALNAVLPAFEALYDSLTDAQKANLLARARRRPAHVLPRPP